MNSTLIVLPKSIKNLKHPDYNPRQIKKEDFEQLKQSLKTFDCVEPAVVNTFSGRENIIIGGNQRIRAAEALGWDAFPCVEVCLNESKEKELNVRLNKNVGEWDFDLLTSNFKDEELLEWGFTPEELKLPTAELVDSEPQIDKAEELNKKWQVQTGDLWQVGEHRLLCGDSTKKEDVRKVIGNEKVDCVFTSPPYAVGVDYGNTYNDTIDNLREMLPKLSAIWLDIVCDGGFAVINFGDIVNASKIVGIKSPCEYPMALEYWPVFRADGWVLWTRRIWCKPGAGTGSMQCISSNRASTNWEHIWTWKKSGPAMFTGQTTGKYASQNGWFDSSRDEGLTVGLKDHGAGMPPLPALFSIFNHSLPKHGVHEPFCGTGTTMVACQNLSRKCFGIEISPAYCAVILDRMQMAFPELEIKKC